MKIVVVAATRDPHRQAEALRAALGLTLRGADVTAVAGSSESPLAQRALDTLVEVGGHRAADIIDLDADAVEVWTGPSPAGFPITRGPRRILHLARTAPPEGAVASGDTVVYLSSADPDELVAAIFANELVVTW